MPAFRSAEDSFRDFYVLKGPMTENRFSAVRANENHWQIDYCPMCGPEMTLALSGQFLCAFMARKNVYWAVADANPAVGASKAAFLSSRPFSGASFGLGGRSS